MAIHFSEISDPLFQRFENSIREKKLKYSVPSAVTLVLLPLANTAQQSRSLFSDIRQPILELLRDEEGEQDVRESVARLFGHVDWQGGRQDDGDRGDNVE
jgi:hypothetical protein